MNKKIEDISYLFEGLLFPFLSVYKVIFNPKTKYGVWIIMLFFFYVGSAQMIDFQEIESDIARVAKDFINLSDRKDLSFFDYFLSLSRSNQIDFYLPFMKWFISRITNSYELFNGVLAGITGIFMANNFLYIARKSNKSPLIFLLLVLLFFIPNIIFITHRWWTALQVFLYGALPFSYENNTKKIIFPILSTIIHFSFLYPLLILIAFKWTPKKHLLPYIIIFYIANLLQSTDLNHILNLSASYLPQLIAERSESYINAQSIDKNFFSKSVRIIWQIINMFMALYLFLKHSNLFKENQDIKKLFILSLLLGSFSAIANLTEWGWRYLDLSNFCFCSMYIMILSKQNLHTYYKIDNIFRWFTPFFIYLILFQIRALLAIIGPKEFFLGNIITTWIIEDQQSLLEIIKESIL